MSTGTGTRLNESIDGLTTYLESMIQTVHVTAELQNSSSVSSLSTEKFKK